MANEQMQNFPPTQEMDLNVYEDDDDETLHRKLIAAKIARKRAEEDHKLLSNRIALLKQEEQKVCWFNCSFYYRHGKNSMKRKSALLILCKLVKETWNKPLRELNAKDRRRKKRLLDSIKIVSTKRWWRLMLMLQRETLRTRSVVMLTISNKRNENRRTSCRYRSTKSRSRTILSSKWLKVSKEKLKISAREI